jgi:N-acetyl-anhydromuramyl-L-alanine amidase AmpD
MKIKQVNFGASHYINQETHKTQIYLHHTAGNDNAEGVFQNWEQTKDRIATCVSIDSNGLIVQGFPSNKWAYHLGIDAKTFNNQGLRYEPLDQISIGIEICNWGYLTKVGEGKEAKFFNYVKREVAVDQVIELEQPFKGHKYWHNYTDAQIEAVKELLLLWNDKYNIPLDYNNDIWGICPRALSGKPGVYTHNSVRKDKTDVYPHPGLIQMLKSLTVKEPVTATKGKKSNSSDKGKK